MKVMFISQLPFNLHIQESAVFYHLPSCLGNLLVTQLTTGNPNQMNTNLMNQFLNQGSCMFLQQGQLLSYGLMAEELPILTAL